MHPHNVIVRAGRVAAFVDIESLKSERRAVAIGFAAYKLVRQCGVAAGGSDMAASRCGRLFVQGVRSAGGLSDSEVSLLEAGALFEVLRRIAIIVHLNMRESTTAWNAVLRMHLAGLREIPVIFQHTRWS